MISHQYKCIFVEVPKTGSTSVRRILGRAIKPHMSLSEIRRLMESYWVVRGGRKDRIMEWLYPMLPAEQRKERGRRQFESYFKFGFVRNPWDRVVSLYERNEAVQMRQQMSFEEFARWIQYSSSTCVHSSPHRYQLDWFVDADGKMLADFQLTVPEYGTIRAKTRPVVVLTSNRTREVHDAIRRRCLYHWVDYPNATRERAILAIKAPGLPETLSAQVVAFVQNLRTADIFKLPGVAETIDWANALNYLDQHELTPETVNETLGVLLKYQDDIATIRGAEAARLVSEAAADAA